jgi:colanic acid biosynthesis glycosyl transferase WcaI
MLKILITHRFFWPDTAPYALISRAIGDELARRGHEVHIFSTLPSYRDGVSASLREKLGALNVKRIPVFRREKHGLFRRLTNVMIYCTALFIEVLRQRPNVVTAATFPPVVAAWSASLAARLTGAQFIYHVQDIHPEVSLYAGQRIGRGAIGRFLCWMDNQTLRRASCIVTLSEDMADTLRARGLGTLPIRIVNNPALDAGMPLETQPVGLAEPQSVRRVIFAGNLGRYQNLHLLAEGVALCFVRHPDLELMFLGEGAVLADLQQRWQGHPQVRFAPFLPFDQARAVIASAEVGLVSLAPNIYRVAYPSKTATYLDLGLKILALVEPHSKLAQTLTQSGRGIAPTDATAEGIAEALEQVLKLPVCSLVNRAVDVSHQSFWPALIEELEALE